jgi:hypothetical protein
MKSVAAALLLAPLVGMLWSGAQVDGQPQIAVTRKADGNLNVNIPDRYVYQRFSYAVAVVGGGTLMVAQYEVIPDLKASAQASGAGIRDTRRLHAPMRMEFSVATPTGEQVEVYSDVYSYRVVIYRKVK